MNKNGLKALEKALAKRKEPECLHINQPRPNWTVEELARPEQLCFQSTCPDCKANCVFYSKID